MPTAYNPKRLFLASCITMIVLGMVFAIRGDTIDALGKQFSLTNEQLGWISGAAFWGFLASILVGGPLCDLLGMNRLLGLAFLGHTGGVLLTIFATGFWTLWIATLAIGLANGFIEASINPLIATVYPDQKTQRLNALHAWFPWGIVIGGLAAYLMTALGVGWQIKTALILVPSLAYGLMYFGQKFPETERVQSGVSTGAMYRELLRPSFLFLAFCMLLDGIHRARPEPMDSRHSHQHGGHAGNSGAGMDQRADGDGAHVRGTGNASPFIAGRAERRRRTCQPSACLD